MDQATLTKEIQRIKEQKGITILAHYYTAPEVQDVADYIGDSLGLAQTAEQSESDTILFCGANYMAETAAILAPNKQIIVPNITIGCTVANSMSAQYVKEWKKSNPEGLVVSYVNSSTEVKAESHICCTSANALKIFLHIPEDRKVLFGPNKNLSNYVKEITGREFDTWDGECTIFKDFVYDRVSALMDQYPDAHFLIHPESSCSSHPQIVYDHRVNILSTSGMVKIVGELPDTQFVILAESGILHQLKAIYPDKEFIPVSSKFQCNTMRKITLQQIYDSLTGAEKKIEIAKEIRERAYPALEKMLYLSVL